MFYAEVLRGRNVLQWTFGGLIVVCALLALAVALFPDHTHVAPGNDAAALAIVAWSAALITAIIGSILGASLANENCHLELVRMKPISPARYAAGVLLVGLGYLLVTFAGTLIFAYVAASMIVGVPLHVAIDQPTALRLLRFLIFPLAWFGLGQALTAGIQSQKLGGMVIGLSWPTAEGLSILATLPLAAQWHAILAFVNLVNPIGYFPFWEVGDDIGGSPLRSHFGYGLTADTLALVAIAVVGAIVATARWRRLEA